MNQQGMKTDGQFDTTAVVAQLPVSKLREIQFSEMLDILSPYVLVQVPENVDENNLTEKRKYDYLLARMANLYAYLRVLWSFASNERAKMRHIDSAKAEDMLKKKEALFELGNAVKLKYEAVSRKITVALADEEETPERPDYSARREQIGNRQTGGGWSNVGR